MSLICNGLVSGHDFSRATNATESMWASALRKALRETRPLAGFSAASNKKARHQAGLFLFENPN
jgi:hypothetical protein